MDDPGVVGLVDAFTHSVQSGVAVAVREPRLIQESTSLGETPLHLLVLGESTDAVRSLLGLGADINVVCDAGETPLSLAASVGHADMVKLLLESGAHTWIDGQRKPILHTAVSSGNLETVKAILDAGVDVNRQADFADTAAHVAAEDDLVEILNLLLLRGADASLRNTFDGTVLDSAQKFGSHACIELLSSRH